MTLEKPAGLGAKLGTYELLKELPAGGLGATWVARRAGEEASTFELLLRLPRHLAKKTEVVDTFAKEARDALGFHHPKALAVVAVEQADGETFAAFEYAEAESLTGLVAAAGAAGLPTRVVLRIAIDVLEALEAAHEHTPSLPHGELNPAHIFVGADGTTRVGGIVLARAFSHASPPLGARNHDRLAYAAPERVKTLSSSTGAPATPRGDLFSVGVIVWEALAKQRLFTSKIEAAIIQKVLTAAIPDLRAQALAVDAALAAAVAGALQRDPEKRTKSARELREALAALDVATPAEVAAEVERLAGKTIAQRRAELEAEVTRRANRQPPLIHPPAATPAKPPALASRKPSLLGIGPAPGGLMAGSRKVTPPGFAALRPPPPPDARESHAAAIHIDDVETVPVSGGRSPAPTLLMGDVEEPVSIEPESASPAHDKPSVDLPRAPAAKAPKAPLVPTPPKPAPKPPVPAAAAADAPPAPKPAAPAQPPPAPLRPAVPAPAPVLMPSVHADKPDKPVSSGHRPTPPGSERYPSSTPSTNSGVLAKNAALEKVGPGSALGRYEILMPVARGGMAAVWAARLPGSRGFRKIFAIKTMLPDVSDDPDFESMFLDEARVAARIRHPNVVEIIDLGEQDEILYLVMEWVDGENLGTLMKAARALGGVPLPIALRIASQIAAGLHAAHELRDDDGNLVDLVHRDVSPANVLVSSSGFVKIVDFGIAKSKGRLHVTRIGSTVKGKTPYLSPEQLGQLPIDRRSDIFSFGVLLYVLATGLHPFRGESDTKTIENIALREPVPLRALKQTIPAEFEALVLKALAKNATDRWETTADMQRALDVIAAAQPESATEQDVGAFVRRAVAESFAKRAADLKAAIDRADGRLNEPTEPSRGFVVPVLDVKGAPLSEELAAKPPATEPPSVSVTTESPGQRAVDAPSPAPHAAPTATPPPAPVAVAAIATPPVRGDAERPRESSNEGSPIAAVLARSDAPGATQPHAARAEGAAEESSARPVMRSETNELQRDTLPPQRARGRVALVAVILACAAVGVLALVSTGSAGKDPTPAGKPPLDATTRPPTVTTTPEPATPASAAPSASATATSPPEPTTPPGVPPTATPPPPVRANDTNRGGRGSPGGPPTTRPSKPPPAPGVPNRPPKHPYEPGGI